MSDHDSPLLSLLLYFSLLSLLAIGGANATIPEMHRVVVEVRGWITDREFGDVFAISQIAPGPNVLIVTLIGFQTAGLAGALVATFAMCGPAALIAFYVSRTVERLRSQRWRAIVLGALAPISIGLIAASAYILTITIDRTWPMAAITVATALIFLRARFNPLWMLAAGAVLGLVGLVD